MRAALSAHGVPALHIQPCGAIPRLSPIASCHDHARLDHMLCEGALPPVDGALHPDRVRPGLELELKRADAARYAV